MFVFLLYTHAASFTGLDKLYHMVKNHLPAVTREKIRKWEDSNLSHSLRKPSRRTFLRNKVYAPGIDSLWDADLPFVQDVAKENDGVK